MREFVKNARKKGWLAGELAKRWGISTRMISIIAKKPSQRDLDALSGVPRKRLKKHANGKEFKA